MGYRGPIPKPTALRILHGDHLERINRHEPCPRNALPECPDGAADQVREVWDYLVAELQAVGIATAADRDALFCLAEAIVLHRRASAAIIREPLSATGRHGGWVRNPAFQIQRDAATTIRLFAAEFGLMPAALANSRRQAGGRR